MTREPHLARRAHSGFTLVEMVVVIMIIGILSAVSVPVFEDIIWESRAASTRENLAQMRTQIIITKATLRVAGARDDILDNMGISYDEDANTARYVLLDAGGTKVPGEDYGPFLQGPIPANGLNGFSKIYTWNGPPPADPVTHCNSVIALGGLDNFQFGWNYYKGTQEIYPTIPSGEIAKFCVDDPEINPAYW